LDFWFSELDQSRWEHFWDSPDAGRDDEETCASCFEDPDTERLGERRVEKYLSAR
jgi:hypothetical protein